MHKKIWKTSQYLLKNPHILKLFFTEFVRTGPRVTWRKAKNKISLLVTASDEKTIYLEDMLICYKKAPENSFEKTYVFDIVIPIYNGYDYLGPLFQSIFRNTSSPYRLIIIDDASPDPRIEQFLNNLKKEKADVLEIIHLRNEKNLGFIASVNRGFDLVKNHCILLNTDVEVPSGWIERLMHPILNDSKIASVTPMTNAGTICSFPHWLEDNPLPEGWNLEDIDHFFKEIDASACDTNLPTSVGFCMGINQKALEEVGTFDPIYGRGYGEENDWCMRALHKGYHHKIAGNLFVYHKHGGSFASQEKVALMKKNSIILKKRYPEYETLIQDFIRKDPLKQLREFIWIRLKTQEAISRILIIDHEFGGGANLYRDQLIEKYLFEDKCVILLTFNRILQRYTINFSLNKKERYTYAIKDLNILDALVKIFQVETLYLNSIVGFLQPLDVLTSIKKVVQSNSLHFIIPLHDYYAVCPSFTLINNKGVFCQLPESKDTCRNCLKAHQDIFKTFNNCEDIVVWRKSWKALLESAEKLLCFSESSKEILEKIYPELGKKFVLRPHEVTGLRKIKVNNKCKSAEITNIAILGGINHAKGSSIVTNLLKKIEEKEIPLVLHLFGEIDKNIHSPSFVEHGRYRREDLPVLMESFQIDLCIIPSICPETFSYTTEEVIKMGLPLIVFDIGAPAERTRKYSKGTVIRPLTSDALFECLEKRCWMK